MMSLLTPQQCSCVLFAAVSYMKYEAVIENWQIQRVREGLPFNRIKLTVFIRYLSSHSCCEIKIAATICLKSVHLRVQVRECKEYHINIVLDCCAGKGE